MHVVGDVPDLQRLHAISIVACSMHYPVMLPVCRAPLEVTVAGPPSYDVVIGTGVLDELPALVGGTARQVLVVHPSALADLGRRRGAQPAAGRGRRGARRRCRTVRPRRRVDVAAGLWSLLGRRAFTRSDAVVGLGGGAATDLAGFVAASWLRGVPVVHVPTTLLGMVDAAVGGKTGVNTGEGKNLVGAFHPPAGVLCDLATLTTLPRAELVSGLAEVVKTGLRGRPADPGAGRGGPRGARSTRRPRAA